MHRYEFSSLVRLELCPDRLDGRSVGKEQVELHHGIWDGIGPLMNHPGGVRFSDDLPSGNSSLTESLVGMDTENVTFVSNRAADVVSDRIHKFHDEMLTLRTDLTTGIARLSGRGVWLFGGRFTLNAKRRS